MNQSIQKIPTPHQTLLNPLNNSKSKYQFSFTKAQRFHSKSCIKGPSKQQDSQYHFYDIPSTNSKKAPSFGAGQKNVIFNQKNDIPPATRYSPTFLDDFDYYSKKANKKNKGFSFSSGRQEVKSTSFLKKNQNPGPGNYNPNPQKSMNNSFISYSMTKDERFKEERQKAQSALGTICVPGPGKYQVKSTIGGANKILSQDKNNNPCLKLILPKNQSRRINTQPQTKIYNPLVTKKGDFITFNKKKGFTMGKSLRSNIIKGQKIPGPGNYHIFSQFIASEK